MADAAARLMAGPFAYSQRFMRDGHFIYGLRVWHVFIDRS
ncbi:MAG: hypothetical protein RLY70_713 [Planctomycetota bacterium]|jgi:hypothetical protein